MRIGRSVGFGLLGVMLSVGALAGETEKTFEAVDCRHRMIYHSPQTPGFTCWVHAWVMPDGSAMVSFHQATGPKEGRARASEALQKKLFPDLVDPRRDMTGLKHSIVYLRSTDSGSTWKKVGESAFLSPVNALIVGGTGLRDGAVLRALFGSYLPYDDDVPGTGLVQRSTDGAKAWSKPISLLPLDSFTAYPAGIRQLRDGRVVILGGVSRVPAGRTWLEYYPVMEPLLLVSDDGGKTWGSPIQVVPEENRKGWSCEECDAVELANGDLFWVFRRSVPEDAQKPLTQRRHTYWQGVTEKHGDTWRPKWVGPSPFPNLGLPSLVATRQGPILLVNAGQWTADAGKTWRPVRNMPARAYYPKGIQLGDGRILVFAHIGSDDPYGVVDQSIIMDSFRLKTR
jgi:hypothetical protein